MWAAPSGDLFVAGNNGIDSYVFQKSGGVWTQTQVSVQTPTSLWGTSATDVWLVGAGGAIAHFDGGSWTSQTGGTTDLSAVRGVGSAGSEQWIVGQAATFLHRTAAVPSWTATPQITSVTLKSLSDIAALSASEAWAVGNTVLHRTAQGWALATAMDDGGVLEDRGLRGVSAIASNDVWAASLTDGAYHWDGTKWTLKSGLADGGALPPLEDISAVGASDVWAVANSGALVFHYDGAAWSEVALTQADGGTASAPFFFTVVARASNDVWAGGPFTVVRYDGTYWTKLNDDPDSGILGPASGLVPLATNDGWVVTGFSDVAFRWNGSGFTTFPISGNWSDGLTFPHASASSASDIWLVATGGIAHWDGSAWTFSDRPSGGLAGVAASNGHAWVVGQDGTILHHAP
jgi:hypothetical protein